MSGAANQHILLDGQVLSAHAASMTTVSETFTAAGAATDAPLAGDAFGVLAAGILVPAVTTLAARSRELFAAAGELSGRVSTAATAAGTAFATLEDDAAATFAGMDS